MHLHQCRCSHEHVRILLHSLRALAKHQGGLEVVLPMGPGNPPVVHIWTTKCVRFRSNPVQKPVPLPLGGPKPDPYPSARGLCQVSQDPSVPMSGAGFRVMLFMLTFELRIANRKILILVYRCLFLMYWPPLKSKTTGKHSLPHPPNES
jgi:hypothetical protein